MKSPIKCQPQKTRNNKDNIRSSQRSNTGKNHNNINGTTHNSNNHNNMNNNNFNKENVEDRVRLEVSFKRNCIIFIFIIFFYYDYIISLHSETFLQSFIH